VLGEAKRRKKAGKYPTPLDVMLANVPEEIAESTRRVMKDRRANWYRMKQAGFDFSDDADFLEPIKEATSETEFITILFEGVAPGFEKNAPLWIDIKAPSNPDEAQGAVIRCEKWSQFYTAVVLYGDKEAKDTLWEMLELQGITPITDRELQGAREMIDLFRQDAIKEGRIPDGAREEELITVDQALTDWIRLRLYPEHNPNQVWRITNACGMTYEETLKSLKE